MIDVTNYKNSLSKINFIDLFAGIGGFRLALESMGAKCVFSSEWNKSCKEVYKNNFKETPQGDIAKILEEDIPNHDLLCAGFPCQPFSISGKREGFNDSRGTLFFDIARISKFHKPKIMILENVKNILTINKGKTLEIIKSILEDELDYNLSIQLLKGNDFGVPQKRERVFFICIHKSLNIKNYKLTEPNLNNLVVRDILEDGNFPELEIKRDDMEIETKKFQKDLLGNYPYKPLRIGTINKGGQGERIYSPDGLGITLSAFGGGPGRKTGAYLINNQIRRLTSRESARMMGFPENFKISMNINHAHTQFGNSVIVNVVQFILKDLVEKKII
jgi:DNA (cytosine-5)-methyltransferase 1